MAKVLSISLPLRIVLVLGALMSGSYVTTMFRTSSFGVSWRDLGGEAVAAFLFTAPLVLPGLLDLGWRRIVVGLISVCTASLIVAEVFGRGQEILVKRHYGSAPTESLRVRRWWPFRH